MNYDFQLDTLSKRRILREGMIFKSRTNGSYARVTKVTDTRVFIQDEGSDESYGELIGYPAYNDRYYLVMNDKDIQEANDCFSEEE